MSPSKEKSGPSTSSGRADLEFSGAVAEQIRAEAREAFPLECCGLLLGEASAITETRPARNVHPTPRTHFEIDPQALIDAHRAARAGGPQVLGYYHSHPTGDPCPSATDRAQSAGDGKVWAIVAGEALEFWRDDPGGFAALSYEVLEA